MSNLEHGTYVALSIIFRIVAFAIFAPAAYQAGVSIEGAVLVLSGLGLGALLAPSPQQ